MRSLFLFMLLLVPLPGYAQQAEARAVALRNGCKPTKVEVIGQTFGTSASIAYRMSCTLLAPATSGQTTPPSTLTIRCKNKLCTAN